MDQADELELLRSVFAVMTAKLEDAAALAAEGQGAQSDHTASLGMAGEIHAAANEVVALAAVTSAIIIAKPLSKRL